MFAFTTKSCLSPLRLTPCKALLCLLAISLSESQLSIPCSSGRDQPWQHLCALQRRCTVVITAPHSALGPWPSKDRSPLGPPCTPCALRTSFLPLSALCLSSLPCTSSIPGHSLSNTSQAVFLQLRDGTLPSLLLQAVFPPMRCPLLFAPMPRGSFPVAAQFTFTDKTPTPLLLQKTAPGFSLRSRGKYCPCH